MPIKRNLFMRRTYFNPMINPRKVGSWKRHQRIGGGGGGIRPPPLKIALRAVFGNLFHTILETYINEEPIPKIRSLALKF